MTDFSTSAPAFKTQKRSNRKLVLLIVIPLLLLLVLPFAGIAGLMYFKHENRLYYVPSQSMTPTLPVDSRVRTKPVSSDDTIERGWIVIYDSKNVVPDSSVDALIKRVVGLPGETIEARAGKVYINDKLLDEPYLESGTETLDLPRTTIPAGSYFVMGDNRLNSQDSRSYGAVPQTEITRHAVQMLTPDRKKL